MEPERRFKNFQVLAFIFVIATIEAFNPQIEKWVDLSYPLSPETPVNTQVYTPLVVDAVKSKSGTSWPGTDLDGVFAAFRYVELYEHTGTHVDAPQHFDEDGKTIEKLYWEELTGPLVVIDISDEVRSSGEKNFHVEAAHLQPFIDSHGAIAPRSFVFLNTGWGDYWTNATKYESEAVCLGESGIDWLFEEAPEMLGFGMDVISPECNAKTLFRLHTTMLPRGQLIVENVKSSGMDQLPPKGSYLMMFPMHLKGGTGSPARLIAVNSGAKLEKFHLIFGVILASMFIVF